MGSLSFLSALFSVSGFYERVFIFLAFVGFFVMNWKSSLRFLMDKLNDFERWFLIFGCFDGVFNGLVLFFMLFLGFMLLKFRGKFSKVGIKKGLLSSLLKMVCFNDDHGVKTSSFECGNTRMKRVLCKDCGDQMFEENNEVLRSNNGGFQNEEMSEVEEVGNEDEMFDVMSLRKMVKVERRKANATHNELEKERMAASSSVEEAMGMILRLQNEKSALQIRVNELERSSKERGLHDQGVIQSLQWIMMKHECDKSLLEEQLRLCREKLRVV